MNYDAFGRVIATEHQYAQGATSGNPISTTHQDRWTNAFDDQQRLVATTSPTGFINTQYDDFGRKKATESGTVGTTVLSEVTYAYDALSRLSTLLTVRRDGLPVDSNATQTGNQPEATRYHFDLLGRPNFTELPNGVVEDYVFDNMDRLDLMQHFQSDSNNADLTDNALKNMFDYSYRADGNRVGLVERFDTSGSGIRPGSSTLTNSYTWAYDSAGRLVSEVLDSSDNSLDQTESFLMDLVGNRIRRTLDKPDTAGDTTDIYTYDASDRILSEQRYAGVFASGNPTGSPAQTTTYTWNATQQSSKTISVPSVSSVFQSMSYGLSGQLERVITTTQDGAGQTTDRKQVEYRYDPKGIRFIASDYAYNNQTATFTLQTSTEYLIDHANFTGYQQTIIETTKTAAGQTTKRISYTYGLDEITQTTTSIDPASGAPTSSTTHTFAHDGHGSTRVLFEAAAVIAQIYTYSAYGELIALHNSLGSNLTSQASPLTSVLYNGESLDPTTGLYNFRARWYSAGNGRFERLDPFAGNPNDPFSFNKYGFVHGDPVQGTDPTGLAEFTVAGITVNITLPTATSFSSFAALEAYTSVVFFELSVQIAELVFLYEVFDFTLTLTIMGIDAIPDTYVNPNKGSNLPVEPYEVGDYDDLSRRASLNGQGQDFNIQHAPQIAHANQVVPDYPPRPAKDEPCIVLPKAEHDPISRAQRTNALDRFTTQPTQSDLIARDFFHLKKYTSTPVSALKNLAGMIKGRYPSMFSRFRR